MSDKKIDLKRKRNQRRYYLHYKVREQGYTLEARARIVFVPYYQDSFTKDVLMLRDVFGYSI